MKAWFIPLVLLFLAAIIGCSGGGAGNPVEAPVGECYESAVQAEGVSHMCWGLWEFVGDESEGTLEAVPLRDGVIHLNALHFLEPPPLTYLTFESKPQFGGGYVDIDIGIRHPFLGLVQFTGFDVCGIVISNGTLTGFGDPDIVIPWNDEDTHLANADGYSAWWNPVNFPANQAQPMLGYKDGLLGIPNAVANYNATVCGYKYFAGGLDKDASLDTLHLPGRGAFANGQQNVRHYKIRIGDGGLRFNYAIDASWKFPTGPQPWVVPDSFPIEANRPEAFYITVVETENSLYYVDDGDKGGTLELQVTVYDWQGPTTIESVGVEWPGLFAYQENTPFAETELSAYYKFELSGENLASADPVGVLVTARDEKTHPKLGNIPSYQIAWGFEVDDQQGVVKEERIVYSSDYNRDLIGRNIYTIDPGGLTDPVQWTVQTDPALWCENAEISPDGRYIVYLRYSWSTLTSELRRIDVTTGVDISLTGEMENWYVTPSWRNDGQKIVYSYAISIFDNGEMYIMNPDGSDKQPLTPTGLYPWTPVYTPDDQQIYFKSFTAEQIYVYDVATGDTAPYTTTGSGVWNDDPDVSPDGQYVAWSTSYPSSGGRKIYISPVTAWDDPWKIIDFETYIRTPSFRPDGGKVVFDHGGDQASEIGIYDLANDTWEDITDNSWGDFMADWGVMIIAD